MEEFDIPVVNITSPSYDEVKEDFEDVTDDNADFYKEMDENVIRIIVIYKKI